MLKNTHHLYLCTGEPAGIGPEITLKALDICLKKTQASSSIIYHLLGDEVHLANLADKLQLSHVLHSHAAHVQCHHHPLIQASLPGQLNIHNTPYVMSILDDAIAQITKFNQQQANTAAMVTAPVHKAIIAAHPDYRTFKGHTDYLAEKAAGKHVLMLLKGEHAHTKQALAVALASVHMPLVQVSSYLMRKGVAGLLEDITLISRSFAAFFQKKKPRIHVAGLNPHAGENGLLGDEEGIIAQAIQAAQAQGMNVHGPYAGDTLFLQDADCFYAMYHDQGLAPFKYASFGMAANITLGLPYVRTSVDHGTALDIAHLGNADACSMVYAIEQAVLMLAANKV